MKLSTYKELHAIVRREVRAWPKDTWSSTDMFHDVMVRMYKRFRSRLWSDPRECVSDGYVCREVRMAYLDRYRRKRACKRGRGWQRIELDSVIGRAHQEGAIGLEHLTRELEQGSQANVDYVIWVALLEGLSPYKIAKHIPLPGCNEDMKRRYIAAKVSQFELELATEAISSEGTI